MYTENETNISSLYIRMSKRGNQYFTECKKNYFAAYVHFVVVLGVKFQIPISAINAIVLNTGFMSTKITLQHDVKHGLTVTTFQYRFSKMKSTARAT
jgi:hypothetical protein